MGKSRPERVHKQEERQCEPEPKPDPCRPPADGG